jgi:uncharacterized protein YuzE
MVPFHFEISTTIGPHGRIDLAYIRLSDNPVARTIEIDADRLLADYDAHDKLVGIEILAPFKIVELSAVLSPDQVAAIEPALPEVLKAA